MKYLVFVFMFFNTLLHVTAANTSIGGTVPGAAGKELRIYMYSDFVTQNEILKTSVTIDKNERFSVSLNISQTQLLIIKIDFFRTTLYAEPGKTYHLLFDSLAKVSFNEAANNLSNQPPIHYIVQGADSNELNNAINRYVNYETDFILSNLTTLMRKRSNKPLNDFKSRMDSLLAPVNSPYFKTFVTYRLASIRESILTESKDSLYAKYFEGKTPETNHDAYMAFFNQFYAKFFTILSRQIKFSSIERIINEQNSFKALSDTMKVEPLLKDNFIRELVLIIALGELNGVSGINRDNIISMLKEVEKSSTYPHNKTVATNILKTLIHYPIGSSATSFTLTDRKLAPYTLSQYKGSFIYLFFWNTSCTSCLSEMAILNSLAEKYKGKLQIIGVSIDREPLQMYYFLEKRDYKFPVLHFGFNFSITDAYMVKSLPHFVLIDPNFEIKACPAPKPSEDIGRFIDAFFRK